MADDYSQFGEVVEDNTQSQYDEFGEVVGSAGPSGQQIAAGLTTEIAIGVTGQATGTALAPFTFGLSYPILSFGSGVVGSAAAQNIEGQEEFSWGRAIADGLINLIPGGKPGKVVVKGGTELAKQTIKSGAIKGTAGTLIGGGYAVTQNVIDEGELPTKEELAVGAVTGAILGTGLGVGGELTSNTVRKYMANPKKLDADLVKGKPEAVDFVNSIEEKTGVDPYAKTEVFTKSMFNFGGAPSRVLGKKITSVASEAQQRAQSGQKFAQDLERKIKSEVKQQENPDEARRILDEYIVGQRNELPASLKTSKVFADETRSEIYRYQDEILTNHYNGTHVLDDALVAKIEESQNAGDYLTRSYRWFSDSSYEPSAESRKKLKVALTRSMDSADEAEKFIRKLDEKKASPESLGDVRRFFRSKDAKVLKQRQQVSSEMREYLGEITDPAEKMGITISNLSRLTAFDTADEQIKRMLVDSGIATSQRQQGSVPLTLRRGAAKEGDEQLFVPKYTQNALNKVYGMGSDISQMDGIPGTLFSLYRNTIGISKIVKVPMNPPSYAVQLYGNAANLMGMGMNPFRGLGKGVKYSAYDFTSELPTAFGGPKMSKAILNKMMGEEGLKEFKRMRSLNLIDSNVALEDLRNALKKDAIGAGIRRVADPLGKGYAGPDTAMRIVAFENNKARLGKMFPESVNNVRGVENIAAEITNNTYQNYNMLSDSIRKLSRYGVLGQFSAFWFELMRNQYNQGRYIKRMLSGEFAEDFADILGPGNVNEIRKEGAKRLAALSVLYGSATGGLMMFNREFGGVDQEDERAYRESVLPEWDEQNSLAIYRDGDKVYYKNMSYVIPHLDAAKMALAGFRGDSPASAMANVTKGLLESVGGEGDFVLSNLFPAMQNYDPDSGRRISGAPTQGERAVEQGGAFIENTFMPGFLREFNRAVNEDQPLKQTLLRQIGIRVNDTTVQDGAGFRLRAISDRMNVISRNLASLRYETEGNPQAFEKGYQKLNQQYQGNIQQVRQHMNNYKTLGYEEDEIIKWAKDAGLSGRNILYALDGVDPDLPKVKRKTPSTVFEEILTDTETKPETAIDQIEDPQLKKSVRQQYREYKMRQRKGISERELIIKSLDVSDGSRADYVWEAMQKSPNPEAYLRGQIQKGVVTEKVLQQVMERKRSAGRGGASY